MASGRIVRIGRGFYGLGLPRGTETLVAAAARTSGVVSHDAAAVLWHLDVAHAPGQHLTVPRNRNRSRVTVDGVDIHRCDLEAREIDQRAVFGVTSVLRTVLACARTLPTCHAVVIADSALRNGLLTRDELVTACSGVTGRGAERVRRVGELADPECASVVLESLLRVLLTDIGLRPPRSQCPIYDGDGCLIAWVDFAWPRAKLLVEADGFEFHSRRTDYRKDRRRWNAFTRMDWRVLRFSWEDVVEHPTYVVDAVRFECAKAGQGQARER